MEGSRGGDGAHGWFFPLDWDAKTGKLYLEVSRLGEDFLLLDQLPYGLGSNDVGLDRGQLGEGRVVHFSRAGNKLLLIEPNLPASRSISVPICPGHICTCEFLCQD